MTDHRRNLGQAGERIARKHLLARGYEVLDANFRTRYGELDLVAADGGCLVFCEVKTRLASGMVAGLGPLSAVGVRKRRRLRMMARQWLASRPRERAPRLGELRFDAIGVTLAHDGRLVRLEHVENAF